MDPTAKSKCLSILNVLCRKSLRLLAVVIFLFYLAGMPVTNAGAEDGEGKLGNWIGATSTLRFSDKWSLFLQGELRTWEMASNLNETLTIFDLIFG